MFRQGGGAPVTAGAVVRKVAEGKICYIRVELESKKWWWEEKKCYKLGFVDYLV